MREIKILLEEESLPTGAHGVTAASDGIYYIVLNRDDDTGRKEAAFLHELLHIYRRDFESKKSVDEIEIEIRKELEAIKEYI